MALCVGSPPLRVCLLPINTRRSGGRVGVLYRGGGSAGGGCAGQSGAGPGAAAEGKSFFVQWFQES